MTPQDWIAALKPEVLNPEADKFIATIVRAHLKANIMLDDLVGTTTLVDAIFPLQFAKQSEAGMAARKRVLDSLIRRLGKTTLADCVTRGPKQRLGSSHFMGRPYLWHAPIELPRCKECGQEIRAA